MKSESVKNDRDRKHDLEEPLLEYAANIVRFCECMTKSDAGRHVSGQLLTLQKQPE
jgi:hypothetical protein